MTAGTCSAFPATNPAGDIVVRDLLVRGMIAGFVAGLLCFGVGKLLGEPQVDRAIAFEEQHAQPEQPAHQHDGSVSGTEQSTAAHEHGDEELVSRKVQSTAGLLTAVAVYSSAMGGLFALAFACLYGRFGNFSPRALALLLVLAAFIAVYYVPSLKYPANPPAVGEPNSIAYRTGLYLLMMLISLGAMVFAVATAKRLSQRCGNLNATMLGVSLYIAIVAIAQILLPDINEVPADFPASVLWKFRMASLGMQAVTWGTLGVLFGVMAERLLKARATAPRIA
jgi:predicted cobalt transporter CbtA